MNLVSKYVVKNLNISRLKEARQERIARQEASKEKRRNARNKKKEL